jgi:hypothetical protein
MNHDDEKSPKAMLANPFYAVVFASHLFNGKTAGAKEDWVLLNVKLIEELGPKEWLNELLDALSLSRAKYDGHDIINPSLAVVISGRLQGDHPSLVERQQWLVANEKLIKELGADAWLWQLLETLETGGPTVDQ